MNRKSQEDVDDAKASKKMKVSQKDENAIVVVGDKELEKEEQWSGLAVLAVQDAVACRGCQTGVATAVWSGSVTGDRWSLCDDCQIQDFGICYKKELQEQDKSSKTHSEDANEVPPCTPTGASPNHSTADNESVSFLEVGESPDAKSNELTTPASSSLPTISQTQDESSPSPSHTKTKTFDNFEGQSKSTESEDQISDGNEEVHNAVDHDGSDDGDGQYDLKKILSVKELQAEGSICCSQDACGGLPAFGLYVNSADSKDRWYYCLDCQEDDFDGWPPKEELPTSYLTPEHIQLMAKKCSARSKPAMPTFLHQSPCPIVMEGSSDCSQQKVIFNPSSRVDNNAVSANFVTSPPQSLVHEKNIDKDRRSKNAKAFKGVHQKWVEAARAMGDKDARIVVSKPHAKKLIFDFLEDAFRPMNITQLYKGLKAVVPQPVLNACLQEMVPDKFNGKTIFTDSDEEDSPNKQEEETPENSEPYSGSLIFKAGKNASTNLYFCDYSKVKIMDQEERNTLFNELAQAKVEHSATQAKCKSINELALKLFAEPTNEELTRQLDVGEKLISDLKQKVEDARKLNVNEKHKKDTKKRVAKIAAVWRQRRRMCLGFLTQLEENTDGSVSRAKCIKGDGQIPIDSDELVAKGALQYAIDKKKSKLHHKSLLRKTFRKSTRKHAASNGITDGFESDLVAVKLDSQLNIVRIYANEE